MSTPNDSEIANAAEIEVLLEKGESLKNVAKRLWLFGEWDKLSRTSIESIQNTDDVAIVSLLISSALLQLNKQEQAEHYLSLAIRHGIKKTLVAKVLIAGTHNTLGRISCLQSKSDDARGNFYKAVDIGISNPELIAHSRAVKEMSNMGLFPQAVELVKSELTRVERSPSVIKNIDAQIKTLKTEVELLQHELSLSQQKLQLYRNEDESASENWIAGSPEHIERLRQLSPSQLGQDLWVLEKTNYKKSGFFVEFGATDGVLLSNTFLLEKQFNWTGICAEPNPNFFEKLKINRSCKVSDSCIAGESDKTVEFIFANEYGGMAEYANDDNHADKRMAFSSIGQKALLKTISLDDFLVKLSAPRKIDYLSIDTEGNEFEILSNFNFKNWDIDLITVEHNFTSRREEIHKLMTSHGYKRLEQKFDDWYYK